MLNYTSLYSRKCLGKYKNIVYLNISGLFSSRPKTHYETLNLSHNCTSKEVREAFIALSKQCHPDKNSGNPKAQEKFVKVNEAYNVLIKPESRRDYDHTLHLQNSSRTYNSTNKGDFYEVHRYDSHYRDPWKDPSFARNRNFSSEKSDSYYGVHGVKKQSNDRILVFIMIFFSCGFLIQLLIIRFSGISHTERLKRMSEENSKYLESVRARAELYGSRERQIEEYLRRVNSQKPDK